VITMQDTQKPTIGTISTTQTWECGYKPANSAYRLATASAYADCYDDWANTKNNVAITITGEYKDSAGGSYSTQTVAIDGGSVGTPYTSGAKAIFGSESIGSGGEKTAWTSHSKAQALQLSYTVSDKFGNAADTYAPTVQLVDTIPPTLYITKKSIDLSGVGTHTMGDKCEVQAGSTTGADVTGEHCANTRVTEGGVSYGLYKHGATDTSGAANSHVVHGATDPLASETTIQHSAGYAADYKFVSELMQEDIGYACYDACSETTTTVAWMSGAGCTSNGGADAEFNMLKPGTYYLKYSCADESGSTTSACRTFINVDKTKPVITVLEAANQNDGTFHIEASRDNNYVDAGATCSDMIDGNISQDVEVSGDVVNMAAVGTYIINYNCEDSAGQTAYPATRTVIVEDTTCPSCAAPNLSVEGGVVVPTIVEASFPYTEDASTCTDTLDGALPDAVVYGHVDVEHTGMYVLTYSVTDKAGNGADPAACHGDKGAHFTKSIIVEDTMVPIISLQYKGNKLSMMAESTTSTVNGWVIGAIASAVSGVALLGYAATRKATVATSVPV
jgi:hypothetical protein